MKKTVRVTMCIELEYDPNSETFKEALESYNECINSETDEDDLILVIAENVSKYGTGDMIEGVGRVRNIRLPKDPEAFCGVTVLDMEVVETEIE